MQKALTAKTLDALKPAAKRYEVHDFHCPDFVRVSVGGQKVFSIKFRYGLKQKRQKLGVYAEASLFWRQTYTALLALRRRGARSSPAVPAC